ncbi:MAG: hypothetical protein JXB88_24200 [Spirochaetales bacterium]|nr:hypothetical protein [Spirochaetales bacterium]
MKKIIYFILITQFLLLQLAFSQNQLYFSTEEDFMAKTADGAVVMVSDGDLLTWNGIIFMRNCDLLIAFKEQFDLGLDAVDVIRSKDKLIAFSTELDSTNNLFNAGDLLITNGAIIPNEALLFNFKLPRNLNLGLDGVQFVGEYEGIIEFCYKAASLPVDYFKEKPEALAEILNQYNIDILFSTEGTAPYPEKPMFLDGDLLSAKNGVIAVPNSNLLPLAVPAGLPSRGVDYGLDAVMFPRASYEKYLYFSTEILNNQPAFTDGDILLMGNGVIIPNSNLIKSFNPRSDFLGLDALSYWEQ